MDSITIKLCGLSTAETMEAALEAGADMVGLVFHPKSPRFVSDETAAMLSARARGRAAVVALVVDLDDRRMDAICDAVKPDWWQLHGREDLPRIRAIRERHGLPVMKAIGWSGESANPGGPPVDEAEVLRLAPHVDRLLIDAKPPKAAAYPGGHGVAFDWTTLKGLASAGSDHSIPFMLSGGLHPGNVAEAIRTVRGLGCRLNGVDVSSGIESAPGYKDIARIRDFVQAARAA